MWEPCNHQECQSWGVGAGDSPCTAMDRGHRHHLSSQEPECISHPHSSPAREERGPQLTKRQTLRPMELEDQLRFMNRTWSEASGIVSSTRLREYLLPGEELLLFSR